MIHKILIFLFSTIVVLIFWFSYQIYFPREPLCEKEMVFTISKGDGFLKIGDELEKEGVISNSFYFKIYAFLSGKFNKFQAGSYIFCINDNISNISKIISRGDIAQKKITIVEGWNIENIAEYLDSLDIADKDSFLKKVKSSDFDDLYWFLEEKPKESSLEGYLFPDTYFIPYNSDVELIIELMLANFNDKLSDELKDEIKNQEKSFFEIITLASLIEKEVRSYEDKRLVSGVIYNRLNINMPLQIDATISYITGKRTVAISIAETKIDSPYNTYKYRGLPIGPICNPGIESIKAALFPKESDYFYYLSKPNGETVFSKTHEKHIIAKNKYLR